MRPSYLLVESDLGSLLDALRRSYDTVIGPRVQDNAVVYGEITSIEDLPRGWTAEQEPGRYRLHRVQDELWFAHAAPAQSLKPWFRPPSERLFKLRRSADGIAFQLGPDSAPKLAIFGARACDLAGLALTDHILLNGPHADARYAARRSEALIIAAQCTTVASTCFCASMGTGPRAEHFDLSLTESTSERGHVFLLEVGSEAGARAIGALELREASELDVSSAHEATERAALAQERRVSPTTARDVLKRNLEHPAWQHIAERCLACANCTSSCPTCFCASLEDSSSLDRSEAERWRRSDSCFNTNFSYVHGGAVRSSLASRYRQWLTHKFSHWYDQFGSSGCVGCGRCITWCPVGIDVTEEIRQFVQDEQRQEATS